MEKLFYVYIMASRSRNLYTGMTNSLPRRAMEHRLGNIPGFTKKYRVERLVYFESFRNPRTAIMREKQIKSWRREKKLALIAQVNPTWLDLGEEWNVGQAKKMQIPRCARDDEQKSAQAADAVASGVRYRDSGGVHRTPETGAKAPSEAGAAAAGLKPRPSASGAEAPGPDTCGRHG